MSLTPRTDTSPTVATDDKPSAELPPLSADEQAAVILALLGEKGAGALAGRLSPHHRARVEAAVTRLKSLNIRQQRALAARFAEALALRRAGLRGGAAAATALADALFGPTPEALPPVADIPPKTIWERLTERKAEDVAAFLAKKGPAVCGLVLAQLPDAYAADIAGALPEDDGARSVAQLAAADAAEVAVRAVAKDLEDAFFGQSGGPGVDESKALRIANLLNRLPTARREAAIEALKQTVDERMMAEIRKGVLGFDALAERLPRNAVPILFREVDEAALLKALAYATGRGSAVPDYFYGNISQRLAGQLKERMGSHAGIDETAGEKAQAEIVGFVLTAAGDGRLTLLDAEEA